MLLTTITPSLPLLLQYLSPHRPTAPPHPQVLVNLLIAAMTSTYERVKEDSQLYWQFERTKVRRGAGGVGAKG